MLFCKVFLSDLIPKGESLGQSKENQGGEVSKQGDQRGRSLQMGFDKAGSSKQGRNKGGMMDLGGGQVDIG